MTVGREMITGRFKGADTDYTSMFEVIAETEKMAEVIYKRATK